MLELQRGTMSLRRKQESMLARGLPLGLNAHCPLFSMVPFAILPFFQAHNKPKGYCTLRYRKSSLNPGIFPFPSSQCPLPSSYPNHEELSSLLCIKIRSLDLRSVQARSFVVECCKSVHVFRKVRDFKKDLDLCARSPDLGHTILRSYLILYLLSIMSKGKCKAITSAPKRAANLTDTILVKCNEHTLHSQSRTTNA